jgi:hypothetical protein
MHILAPSSVRVPFGIKLPDLPAPGDSGILTPKDLFPTYVVAMQQFVRYYLRQGSEPTVKPGLYFQGLAIQSKKLGEMHGVFSTDPAFPNVGIGFFIEYTHPKLGPCVSRIKYDKARQALFVASENKGQVTMFFVNFDPNQPVNTTDTVTTLGNTSYRVGVGQQPQPIPLNTDLMYLGMSAVGTFVYAAASEAKILDKIKQQ